ncbi:anhydro-N-acetylmuramic acid kinase [Paenibacillus vini]|uniref:anhydro-N-acetylmuramic acid kinase n=1 Tax=Paenibacillus vini TaxID=1476024 RepID=UPI0025B694AC|nr:anhydro-N-acetylmuramic acid kinase [Paenibacillus vini]MDN4069089.1 anhydro-N-acetylmuramic acid kinase [Paenibacillus vini]
MSDADILHAAKSRYAVGLMSGTSVDGIDAALVKIAGLPGTKVEVELVSFKNSPYPVRVRDEILALFDPEKATIDRVGRLNVWLGELFAEAALSVIAMSGLSPEDIAFIGSHGQTLYHSPEAENIDGYDLRYTVQIGEGAVIAARTGITCISDFRVADMAAGGQGAPLVPFTEYLLYGEEKRTLLLQNIGGIGNMTVIPAGCAAEDVFAFDTGPGNMLIDGVVTRLTHGAKTMDAGGVIARGGRPDSGLLSLLMQEPYYSRGLPKSTGRELFGTAYVDRLLNYQQEFGLSDADLVATVTRLSVRSIGDAYRRFVRDRYSADLLIVGGGGSYNPVLMEGLKQEMASLGVQVLSQEDLGFHSDAKEAMAFALLADYTLANRPNNLPGVTGAEKPVVMGKISLSNPGGDRERGAKT